MSGIYLPFVAPLATTVISLLDVYAGCGFVCGGRAPDWCGLRFGVILVSDPLFWGGTPSVLSVAQTERITRALAAHLRTPAQWREATIEVNPEDITREALEGWLKCGFDRISIGVQSFEGAQLEWMNRKHSAEQASEAVLLARDAGFAKISVDLIYGLPFREEVSWERTV